jgi:hypothetical protein
MPTEIKTLGYKYDELSEDEKQTVLETHYDINVDSDFWYDYDGKTGFTSAEIGKYKLVNPPCDLISYKKLYFDLDRSNYIQFMDAEFTDNETARKFLGIPKKLWNRVYFTINDCPSREGNTRLEYESQDGEEFTAKQIEILDRAVERFADKISEALSDLRKCFEWNMSREAIEETLRMNDYLFDKQTGRIIR